MNTPDSAQNPPTSFPGQMCREMKDKVIEKYRAEFLG